MILLQTNFWSYMIGLNFLKENIFEESTLSRSHWQLINKENSEGVIWYGKVSYGIICWWDSWHMARSVVPLTCGLYYRPETRSFTNNPNGVSWINISLDVHSIVSQIAFRGLQNNSKICFPQFYFFYSPIRYRRVVGLNWTRRESPFTWPGQFTVPEGFPLD